MIDGREMHSRLYEVQTSQAEIKSESICGFYTEISIRGAAGSRRLKDPVSRRSGNVC